MRSERAPARRVATPSEVHAQHRLLVPADERDLSSKNSVSEAPTLIELDR